MTITPVVLRSLFVDNATDNGFQQDSGVVAATAAGDFYAIWRDSGNFNSGHSDIVGRHFDTLGNPIGGDVSLLPLNNAFGVPFNALQPATVALPIAGQAEGMATAFSDNFNNGPDFDVYVVRTNASLSRLENPLLIDGSTSVANDPSVTSFADGGLVVSYTIQNSTTDWDILARTVSPSGVVGPVITIFNDTDRSDLSDLATLKNGNFVAVFESQFLGSPTDLDAFFTIKTENGTNVVSPTVVTGAGSTAAETNPHVAALAGGGFVVTWTDSAGDVNGTSQGIRASVYDASGNLVNGDILVNQFNQTGTQLSNDVTALPDGGFAVVWEDVAANVDRVQRFGGAGNIVGAPVTISNLATFDVNAATLTDGRSVYTINDFSSGNNNTDSTILDTRVITPNPPPPAGTTADMILRHSSYGLYEVYDISNNAISAAYEMGQVGTDWQFVALGGFFGSDTTDMMLRNSNTGGFEVYDISNNNITGAAFLGAIGQEWQLMGFGNFSSLGETDMMLRNINTGGVEVCDISNNQITSVPFLGTVGLNWQFSGVGNFSGRGTSDMILRDSNGGGLEVYDINNNQITNAAFIGTVGLDWQFSGVGNFSGVPGETDLLLRNSNTGGLEVYDINNNQITGAAFIGTVGLDWQFAGIGPVHGAGESDLVLRNKNSGAFEVYDIAGNSLVGAASLGAVGLDWQLGGFAADPPSAPAGGSDGSTSQLVQAMAGFTGSSGAGESLNPASLGADTSQQTLLTTPQHA